MPHVEYDSLTDTFAVSTVWNEKELIQSIPGAKWDANGHTWRTPATWASLVTLRGVFQQALTLGESAHTKGWDIRQSRVDPALLKRSEITPDPADDTPLLDALYPFQAAGVQFMSVAQSGLLGDEMGTGKTIQILGLINARQTQAGDGVPALIICPNSVKHQWVESIERWLPWATPYTIDGSAAVRRKVLAAATSDPTAIVIVNIESVRLFSRLAPYGSIRLKRCRECDPKFGDENLKSSRCDVHLKELNKIPFTFIALDEAHRVKDPKSQQTRAIWYVGHQPGVKTRWAMTGTPVANHPGDLWSIMHFTNPDEFPTRGKFIDRYCTPPDSMVWMADGAFKQIGDILPGDQVMGFDKTPIVGKGKQPMYGPTRVIAINRRTADLVRVTLDNGDSFLCTPDHRWLTGMRRSSNNGPRVMEFSEPTPGMTMKHIVTVPPPLPPELERDAAWLGGLWDGEGTFRRIAQSSAANPEIHAHIGDVLKRLDIPYSVIDSGYMMLGGRDTYAKFLHYCQPVKRYTQAKKFFNGSITGTGSSGNSRWEHNKRSVTTRVVSVEPAGHGEVVSLTTETQTYIVHGYASHNCLSAWNAQGTMDIVGIRPDTREEFFRLLDPRFRRTLKATVLPQLPPKIREVRYATMSPAQRRMYQELSSSLITRTPDGQLLLAPTELAATTRLMQLAAASLKIDKPNPDDPTTWKVHLTDPSPKLDVFEEVLDEIGVLRRHYEGPPVLVAAEHLQLLKLAVNRAAKHGVRYGVISGEIAPVDRQHVLRELQHGRIRVLFFTSKAGGVGLNMTAADTLINLQRSWSLVDEVQKESRNHRIGSEIHEAIRIIDIVTSDTVEGDQIIRLHEKFARLEEITRDRAALLRANPYASTYELDQQEELILSTYLGLPSAA